MRINTNVSSLNAQRLLSNTNDQVKNSMAKLSSGFRITKAGDDAAGLAIANKFGADVRSLGKASQNVSEAQSMLQVAEGAASTIQDILVRMKELATQAASTNASTQLSVLNDEFGSMAKEIDRIADSTNYQGVKLLSGDFASKSFQIGSGTTSNDALSVTIRTNATDTSGLKTDHLGIDSDNLNSINGATTAMGNLDEALKRVNTMLGDLGSYQNRLDYAQQNLQTQIQNYQASESVIRDVDMAAEMTTLSKRQILQQAGTAMLAQANQGAQGVLSLLR